MTSLFLLAFYATLLALALAGFFRHETRAIKAAAQTATTAAAEVTAAAKTTSHAANKAWHDTKGSRSW